MASVPDIPTVNESLIQIKDVVTWLIALVGIAATGFGLLHQLRKNLANSLHIQRENSKQDYQLKIYRDFAGRIEAFEDANYRLGVVLHQIISVFGSYFDNKISADVKKTIIPSWRMAELNNLLEGSQRERDRMRMWIDLNGIVSPHFRVFERALVSNMFDENDRFRNLHPLLVMRLPINVKDSIVFTPPTVSEYEDLKVATSAYLHMLSVERSYMSDLETLVQNVLLGGIFNNKADVRFHVDGTPRIGIEKEEDYLKWLSYFQLKIDARTGAMTSAPRK